MPEATQLAPHLLPGQNHPADPKAEALKNPASQLPTSKPAGSKPPVPALLAPVKESQFTTRHFTVPIPAEHTPVMLLEPHYWMHNAKRLQINDKLDCLSMSGQWEATLRVINKGDTWVKMRLLNAYLAKTDESVAPIRDSFKVDFVPSQGHRVIHKESRAVISSGHQTKDAALAALDLHIEGLSRQR